MGIPKVLKPSTHKVELTKIFLSLIAVAFLVLAILTVIQQNERSNMAVQSHTQTLNEIKQAVITIEANQKNNSSSIISYINCLINSQVTQPSQFQVTEQACRTNVPQVK